MVKVKVADEVVFSALRAKIRLDYQAEGKQRSFLFGGKNVERLAEETREQKVALLRNVPVQGVKIEDVDLTQEIYTVYDEDANSETAFAPVILTVTADTVEDVLKFVMRSEFRKIEIIEPEEAFFTKFDIERILFKINEELHTFKRHLEKKYLK